MTPVYIAILHVIDSVGGGAWLTTLCRQKTGAVELNIIEFPGYEPVS